MGGSVVVVSTVSTVGSLLTIVGATVFTGAAPLPITDMGGLGTVLVNCEGQNSVAELLEFKLLPAVVDEPMEVQLGSI